MLAIFLTLFILGVAAALTMKTSYQAHASVLARLGPEYVYAPRVGDAGRGAVLGSDAMIQSEAEILGSEALKLRVIERLGLARTYPHLAEKYAKATPAEKKIIVGTAIRAIEQNLKIETAPDTPIVRVGFSHNDPQAAALILNTLLEEYLIYRRVVLVDTPALEQQRQLFETRLADADAAYQEFLSSNGIGDFVAEKASLSQLQAQIEQQKQQTAVQLQDRIGRLASLNAQLGQVSREVGNYRDRAPGEGAKRGGGNLVYQTLQTEKIQLTAEVGALRRAQVELAGQRDRLTERRLKLNALELRFQELSLNRDVLQASVRDFAVKEEQSRAAQEIAARGSENIRIVQRANAPITGKSLRKPVVASAFLIASLAALLAGLLAMFLRPGLPTAQSAARTLDLPVLGAAPLKAR
ncbi:MAG: lipopolysaccharide biosynthesis protein [Phenylobacterium sp.]|nr:lipopolysaccharide biosynthesis protein [Phenylobacterium sp.]